MAQSDVKFTIGGDNSNLLSSLSSAEKAVVKTGDKITSAFKVTGAAISGAISAYAINQVVEIADEYTLLEGRLKLVVDSTEELTRVQEDLYSISQQTRQEYAQTATLYTNLARATKDLSLDQHSLVGITETLNQAFIVSGASQEESANSMRQFNQAMIGGVVRAEEYNSMLENTPRVLEAVADGLGVTMGQLRAMMLEGKLSSELFLKGLQDGAADIKREFEQLPVTVGQAMTTLENAFKGIIADANETSGATDGIALAIQELATTIDNNRETIVSLFSGLVEGAGWVIDVFGDMATEIKVMAAVAADELSVMEYIGMSMQDMRAWVDDWEAGTASTLGRIAVLQDKIADLESSPRANWAVNKEKLKEYQDELVALYAEMDKQQQEYADKSVETTETSNKKIVTSAKTTTTELCNENKERLSCAEKALKKEVDAAVKAGEKMTDFWQIQYEDRYDIQSRVLDYEIQAEEEKNAAILADLEQLMEDESQLWEGEVAEVTKLNELLVNDLGQIMSGFVEDVLRGEIDTIGDMFESLFDSILDMFIRLVGQIAANSLVEAMGFGGTGGLSIQGLLGGSSPISNAITGLSLGSLIDKGASYFGIGGAVTGTAAAYSSAAFGGGAYEATTVLGQGAYDMAADAFMTAAADTGFASSSLPTLAITETTSQVAAPTVGASALGIAAMALAPIAITAFGEAFGTQLERYDTGAVAKDTGIAIEDYTRSMQDSIQSLVSATGQEELYASTLNLGATRVTYMADTLGDATARMSLQADGSVESIDSIIEALTGQEVASDVSAGMLWLMSEAIDGNAAAALAFENNLVSLGVEQERAATATMGIASALSQIPDEINIDVKVNQEIVSSIQSSTVSTKGGDRVSDVGWTGWDYSNWLQENHATGGVMTGGVMTSPTVFHVGGEAGSEAIVPLHNGPDTLAKMDAKIDANNDELVSVNVAIIKQLQILNKKIERWDKLGMPEARS